MLLKHFLPALEAVAKLRVRRFSGLFWPIFRSFFGDNINIRILPPKNERKIGSKGPENRLNLSFATASLILSAQLILSGCCRDYITAYTDYLSRETLASYHVSTPDPNLNCPPIGQRLIISWSLPSELLNTSDLHLEATVRFRNMQQKVFNIPVCKISGTWMFALVNEDYFNCGGIVTYKVDLIGSGTILAEWRHQIWNELIEFPSE